MTYEAITMIFAGVLGLFGPPLFFMLLTCDWEASNPNDS